MKKIYFALVVFAFPFALQAQQKPQFSQYMVNTYLINPAVTGIEDYTNVKFGYRRQWVGLAGAPQSYYLTAHGAIGPKMHKSPTGQKGRKTFIPYRKIGKANGSINELRKGKPHQGLGGAILSDETGPIKTTGINATYAVHIPITNKIKIAGGLSGGIMTLKFNPAEIETAVANDPALNMPVVKETLLDLTLGTWVYSEWFFVGASVPQLINNRRNLAKLSYLDDGFALQEHFYVTGGLKLPVTENFAFVPSALVKFAKPSPVAVDLNARVVFRDAVWAGVSYRHEDATVLMVGFNLGPVLEAGYSYDATNSELSTISAGSHELMVGLKLFNPNKVSCPLWMW